MRNREQYQDFLKCLSLFSEDIISKQELISLMMDSLSRHPDLQVNMACPRLCYMSNMAIVLKSVIGKTGRRHAASFLWHAVVTKVGLANCPHIVTCLCAGWIP